MSKENTTNHHVSMFYKGKIKYKNYVVSLQTILLSVAMGDKHRTCKYNSQGIQMSQF